MTVIKDPKDAEIERLQIELGRAYRALHGYYVAHRDSKLVSEATQVYHSLTLAAAKRHIYLSDNPLDGADFFIGKHYSHLHEALRLGEDNGRSIPNDTPDTPEAKV